MSFETATAIVIRAVEFSETSLVVTLFSREVGKMAGLAKGGRRVKGPFASALDLLARSRITFLRKPADRLDLLTEARLIRRFRPLGRDLSPWYAGYYVAELLDGLTDQYDPHPELYDLSEQTLDALIDAQAVATVITRFELGALRALGHMPTLDRCADCGRPVRGDRRVPLGMLDGGVLCDEHRTGKRAVVSVSANGLAVMRALADPGSEQWRQMELDRRQLGELRGVITQYMAHLLGHRPRTLAYLANLAR